MRPRGLRPGGRRSIRLPGYDYTRPGAYFVTTATRGRECLFGEVRGGIMVLNPAGRIVEAAWHDLAAHYAHVQLDAFVVMPNHMHGVMILVDDEAIVRVESASAPTLSRTRASGTSTAKNASGWRPLDDVGAGLSPAP